MKEIDSNVKNCEPKRNQVILQGIVVFRRSDNGSKSEHLKPFLLTKDNSTISLYKKDDNPFENDSLKKFKGAYVQVVGHFHNNIFVISDITEIIDGNDEV